jgi:hypothetical protein
MRMFRVLSQDLARAGAGAGLVSLSLNRGRYFPSFVDRFENPLHLPEVAALVSGQHAEGSVSV